MINVTRLDNTEITINSDLIEMVESIPETMIHLTTGKKIMVSEKIEQIVEKVAEFRKSINCGFVVRHNEEGK